MNSPLLHLDNTAEKSLYVQVYEEFRERILSGELPQGSKMPSLRRLAKENDVSITTVETAYNQLLVEGYIVSRPKSGYYVGNDIAAAVGTQEAGRKEESLEDFLESDDARAARERALIYDEESFEFAKWKKCMNRVFNEYSHLLRTEADVQGEAALRYEIARYLYQSRGVRCTPEQVVIGAGSQQLTTHLIRIFRELGIGSAAVEVPGYGPIRNIFKEENFDLTGVPVARNGIVIEKLPEGQRCVAYVNPSNQFPTGAVMPIGRRYELIRWAEAQDSYILEDDYDSELRYFGKPVPALQGLDSSGRVIYLGSFAATLFAAIRISYMVLPKELMEVFDRIKNKYSQTCSKAEQICLALYMEEGYYHRHIKKCRIRNAGKLETTMKMFRECRCDAIDVVDSRSGLAVMLRVHTRVPAEQLCRTGKDVGLTIRAVDDLCTEDEQVLLFYFYRVSDALLRILIKMYVKNVTRLIGRAKG
ncbi:MAG: PLP-dependent aminotransferase family protein [Mogibacterium sp.]|nr:PLP-dependent aminotransferase family protein [Mogibacterium sp.]